MGIFPELSVVIWISSNILRTLIYVLLCMREYAMDCNNSNTMDLSTIFLSVLYSYV